MAAEETPQVDFLARTLEMRHIAVLRDQRLAALTADGPGEHLCKEPVALCDGILHLAVPGYEGRYAATCPFHQTATCPACTAQQRQAERDFLRELLGTDSELMEATDQALTAAFREPVLRWQATAAARIAKGEGLMLSGGTGSGKSSACVRLALAAYRAGASVCWRESALAFDGLFRGDGEDLHSADVLVLDDFGYEYRSEVVMPRFHVLMNRRWHSRKVTVIATMLSQETLLADTGLKAIFSRLRQRNVWLETAQEDRRKPMTLNDWS